MHTINPEKLTELKELDDDGSDSVLKELINLYLESTPPKLKKIQEAIAAKDYLIARKESHSLKSSSLTLGAEILSKHASDIEYAKDGEEETTMSQSFLKAQDEFSHVKTLLSSFL